MESSPRSLSSSRFVIEDSIPKVTSDGEPHEIMTMVAMISGLIAAAIVLFILFSLIGQRRQTNDSDEPSSTGSNVDSKTASPILPIFSTPKKVAELDKSQPQLLSVSSISERISNMEGSINLGFRSCPSDPHCTLNTSTLSGISTVHC